MDASAKWQPKASGEGGIFWVLTINTAILVRYCIIGLQDIITKGSCVKHTWALSIKLCVNPQSSQNVKVSSERKSGTEIMRTPKDWGTACSCQPASPEPGPSLWCPANTHRKQLWHPCSAPGVWLRHLVITPLILCFPDLPGFWPYDLSFCL